MSPAPPRTMRSVRVPIHESRDASYEVLVGRGALERLPEVLRAACPAASYAVIADHRVAELYGPKLMSLLEKAGLQTVLLEFPSGEWNKSREQWSELTDRLLDSRVGRDGAVVAFGGGVAGDLAGFVAATYQRGIPHVQLPTSLLAMIDSSIGGKTGVDVPAGKNLVGAFHQPRAVVADVELLATLPRAHLASGLAEAVKHGAIADAAYLATLENAKPLLARQLELLEPVVTRSVELKAALVARDERETGIRSILNFGHTVGHAVEAASGYELLHGEAVAIGMVAEAVMAETAGLAEAGTAARIRSILEACALPGSIPAHLDSDSLLELMEADKKTRGGVVRFAVPSRPGEACRGKDGNWTHAFAAEVIRQALDSSRE